MDDLFDAGRIAAAQLQNKRRIEAEAAKPARRGDPSTSHEAAAAIAPKVSKIKADVEAYAKSRGIIGFTDIDLNEHFKSTGSTYRSRRAELVRAGLIIDSGARQKIAGHNHIVWKHA